VKADRRAGPGVRLGWGAGSLGTGTLYNGLALFGLFFLTSVVGIEPVIAGGLLFVTKLYEYGSGPSLLLTVASPGPLLIDDQTGRAEVAPGLREYELSGTVLRGHFDDARAAIETLLAAHDIPVRNTTGSVRGISFVEHVLVAGDEITAVGYARRVVARTARGGVSGGYRDVLTQVELGAQGGATVLVSDDPRTTGPAHAR